MKKGWWTLGVGVAGFFIGGKAGAASGAALGALWGAIIGFGFGSIFSEQRPTSLLVAYWAGTLAFVGPFFGVLIEAVPRPYVSHGQLVSAAIIGALTGIAVGGCAGAIQWRTRVRKSNAGRAFK